MTVDTMVRSVELVASCERFVVGHGPRRPEMLVTEISDLGLEAIDAYGTGGVVAELESEVSALLDKPDAVFMPSGTMAQQIALRVHADRRSSDVVLWHPTCHLELHEGGSVERLHRLQPRPVGDARRLMTIDDLRGVEEVASVLLVELPQREIGGQLPEWDELIAQVEFARASETAVHLDGARLLECLPYYEKTAAEVAAIFDSVYLSLYKGLGGLGGCVLAGDEHMIAEAREWQLRHGGRAFAMWPYAASGLACLRRRADLMPLYTEHARAVCAELSGLERVTVVPIPPVTPMAHLYLSSNREALATAARGMALDKKVWTWGYFRSTDLPGHVAVELTVGDATLGWSPEEIRELVVELLERADSAAEGLCG